MVDKVRGTNLTVVFDHTTGQFLVFDTREEAAAFEASLPPWPEDPEDWRPDPDSDLADLVWPKRE